jgi:hypothetical protein
MSTILPCIALFFFGWHLGFWYANKLFDQRYDNLESKIQDYAESVYSKMDELREELK